jgi:putative transposase
VSIWTLDQRQSIPFVCGARQRALLPFRRGETDLAFVGDNWYLFASCEIETPEPIDVEDALGIDLGVTNIATDSDGEVHSGRAIKNVRYRHRRLRNKLQRKRTLGSRRRLRKLAGQERRFATHVNHCLSKRIVATAGVPSGPHKASDSVGEPDAHSHAGEGSTVAARNTP